MARLVHRTASAVAALPQRFANVQDTLRAGSLSSGALLTL
jgi:hypothetical protein